MKKKIDIIFDSENENGDKLFHLASGYISETTVFFEKENLTAVIQASGCVALYDEENTLIASSKAPEVDSGKKVYEDICFQATNGQLILKFPIYKWIDNYPHCDGEHDRWDTVILGYDSLTFDLKTRSFIQK